MSGSSGEVSACFTPTPKALASLNCSLSSWYEERSGCQINASHRFCCAYLRSMGFSLDVRKLTVLSYCGPPIEQVLPKMATVQSEYTSCWNSAHQKACLILTCSIKPGCRWTWLLQRKDMGWLEGMCVSICYCLYHDFKETRLFWESFLTGLQWSSEILKIVVLLADFFPLENILACS